MSKNILNLYKPNLKMEYADTGILNVFIICVCFKMYQRGNNSAIFAVQKLQLVLTILKKKYLKKKIDLK